MTEPAKAPRRLHERLRRKKYNKPEAKHGKRAAGAAAAGAAIEEIAGGGGDDAAAAKLRDQLQRLQAEFENYRRRTRKDIDDIRKTAGTGIIKNLLPIVDNLDRALSTPAASVESFREGVQMIHSLFTNLLRDSGLEKVPALGAPFDPHLHEAVMTDAASDAEDNSIIEVFQEGYMLEGKLLRPAMVKVARKG